MLTAVEPPTPSTRPWRRYSIRQDLNRAAVAIYASLWLCVISFYFMFFYNNLPPKFSLELTEATASLGVSIPPAAFNVTLYAANRKRDGRCYRHGEAAVLYSGLTVAWGRTPRFCVGAAGARDVAFVAWADGSVELPGSTRDRMAAEWRAGAVDLDVDVRLFREDDGSFMPTWMRCKVTVRGAAAEVTPCKVFALQNWASDVVPFWMEQ